MIAARTPQVERDARLLSPVWLSSAWKGGDEKLNSLRREERKKKRKKKMKSW